MMVPDTPYEFKLKSPPSDGISAVKFGPNSTQFLLVSSWDTSVRLYDVKNNVMRLKYHHLGAVLDCCFYDAVHAYSGGLDQVVKVIDFNACSEMVIGHHEKAVRCVEYCPEVNVIITGSWDKTAKFWDPRTPSAIGSIFQPDKVYTLAVCDNKLVIGTAARKVLIWDMRNMGYMLQSRESSLKYQTRCIRCFPNKQGYALSSIEGRVAIEYFDPKPEIQKKKYAFKCHRIKENGIERIYPVNAISFHSVYHTFATGGSDGFVVIWDGHNKKRLCQSHRYPTSIPSLSFSDDGSIIAVASSYIYEEEEPETKPEAAIYIRRISDDEAKPK